MTTTAAHAGFIADICEHPEDDTPRLILADWLQDHGEEERAEFIRVQVELAKVQPEPEKVCAGITFDHPRQVRNHAEQCEWCKWSRQWSHVRFRLRERQTILLDDHRREWFPLPGLSGPGFGENMLLCWWPEGDSRGASVVMEAHPSRGFIAEIHAPLAVLLQHLPALVRQHPIERVRVTDKEPDHYPELTDLWPEHWSWWSNNDSDPSSVKKQVWDILDGFDPGYTSMEEECKNFPTADAAHAALSEVLLRLAKNPTS